MPKGLLIALAGGLLCAILFLTVRTASPASVLLAFMSPLPLFMVGLSQGLTGVLIASGAASIAVGVATDHYSLLIFLLRDVAPALIVTRQGLLSRPGPQAGQVEWYPPGLLLSWMTVFCVAVLAGASLRHMAHEGGLDGAMRSYFETAFGAVLQQPLDPRFRALVDAIPRYLPGTTIAMNLLLAIVSGTLGQAILVRAGHARRPTPAYSAFELPRWMLAMLAGALVLSFMPGGLSAFGRNAAVVMAVPFLLLGFAVVHTISHRLAGRGFFLFLLYVLVVVLVWPAFFVIILGIIDQWLLLRRRFAPPHKGPEDE